MLTLIPSRLGMYSRNAWGGPVDPFILTMFPNTSIEGIDDPVVSLIIFEWKDYDYIGAYSDPESMKVKSQSHNGVLSIFGGYLVAYNRTPRRPKFAIPMPSRMTSARKRIWVNIFLRLMLPRSPTTQSSPRLFTSRTPSRSTTLSPRLVIIVWPHILTMPLSSVAWWSSVRRTANYLPHRFRSSRSTEASPFSTPSLSCTYYRAGMRDEFC